MMNGICAVDPGEHRRLFDHRQNLVGHLLDDLIRITVREKTRRAAAAGHPVPARVVDDEQVDAARFLADGGQSGPGTAADDRLATRDLRAEATRESPVGNCRPSRRVSCRRVSGLPRRATFPRAGVFAASIRAASAPRLPQTPGR